MKNTKCSTHSSGKTVRTEFTLIEMLVVIAIIGILASLMMPSLGKALESARMTFCSNNKKQLYLGFAQYADVNSYLPPRDDGAPNYRRWYSGSFIGQFIGSPTGFNSNPKNEVLYCPSYDRQALSDLGSGYNYFWGNRINRDASTSKKVVPYTRFAKPSRIILTADSAKSYQFSTYNPDDSFGLGPAYRHAGICTILFAAGNAGTGYDLQAQASAHEFTTVAAP